MTKEQVQERIETIKNAYDVMEICNTDVIKSDTDLKNLLLLAIVRKGADQYHETLQMCHIMKKKDLL